METFSREERLHSKPEIDELFSKGRSFKLFPFRVIFLPAPPENRSPARLLIGVPAKYTRRAVDRNLIKRRIREAYRRNKSDFYLKLKKRNRKIHLALIYISHDIVDYHSIEQKIIIILRRLVSDRNEDTG